MKTNHETKQLCLDLMTTNTEDEVIGHLKDNGYWDNDSLWRFYGDYENNFNVIGNQQSRPDAALVEKLVNSVDARLMNECLSRGILPEDQDMAPKTALEAVARFFGNNHGSRRRTGGLISEWLDRERTEVAKGITLAATGYKPKGNPCFTISDCGEGQTPDAMPETLVSLNRDIKLRIQFVQGKFNMGGTGVLKFCGTHHLQLILSRRNPRLLVGKNVSESDGKWGFTVIRREDPEGGRKSSVYTYLSPIDASLKPRRGEVLRFSSDRMPIFPEGNKPYVRESEWGTLVKIYEYSASGYTNSHILRKDGLLGRIDLLLPQVALPIRFHECRDYGGKEGSWATNLTGISVRLSADKQENVEQGFPNSCKVSAMGETMLATVYAFKKGKAEGYRAREGVVFTVNGQTHGSFSIDFFRRQKRVGLSYLADSILVIVDCSNFSGRAREDLFMNSRDRLSSCRLRKEIENSLEELLHDHAELRALKERRRREELASKLEHDKPLEDILKSILEKSPTLSELFLKGTRASNPFKPKKVADSDDPFQGRTYPTFFRFRGKNYGVQLNRDCNINQRCRITFETDAANDYFVREIDAGEFGLVELGDQSQKAVLNYSLNLQSGVATLNLRLPDDCQKDDAIRFLATVTDPSRVDPFENSFEIRIMGPAASQTGGNGGKPKSPGEREGNVRDLPGGIDLPNVVTVSEQEWEQYEFSKYSALTIKNAGPSEAEDDTDENPVYDFFVNMDNLYLNSYLKANIQNKEIVRARFKYGLVLLGLALLHHKKTAPARQPTSNPDRDQEEDEDQPNVEDWVKEVSEAYAPVLLPTIEFLGDLDEETVAEASGSEEDN